jgi:hypothetical protein
MGTQVQSEIMTFTRFFRVIGTQDLPSVFSVEEQVVESYEHSEYDDDE